MKILPGFTRPQLHKLLCEKGYLIGAEIGVQAGVHAEQLLSVWPGTLILIDPWTQYDYGIYTDMANIATEEQELYMTDCFRRMAKFGDRAQVVRMFSHEAAVKMPDASLDFVYIDGNHTYPYVKRDLELWYPKVKVGGLVSGHDYTVNAEDIIRGFGVKPAVNEFVADKIDELYVSDEEWPNWAFFKPSLAIGATHGK